MVVAVIGGTGGLGAHVVAELVERGHEVRIVSRRAPESMAPGVTHHRADLATGEGLDAAFTGVDVVVDAVNSQKQATEILVDGTRRVLQAEQRAGVAHHVEVSIVGCDRIPVGYYNAKVQQERVVMDGPVPWTLLRATQFHSFVDQILAGAAKFRIVPTGSAKFQPVDVREVAARLVDAVEDGPQGRMPDVGGPDVHTLAELSAMWRAHNGRVLIPVRIPLPGTAGRALRDGAACLGEHSRPGWIGFDEWLDARTRQDVSL